VWRSPNVFYIEAPPIAKQRPVFEAGRVKETRTQRRKIVVSDRGPKPRKNAQTFLFQHRVSQAAYDTSISATKDLQGVRETCPQAKPIYPENERCFVSPERIASGA
jgi:hypothetical protein